MKTYVAGANGLADQLVAAVADGEKVIIRGAGHAPYMNDPGAFHVELLKFLQRVFKT